MAATWWLDSLVVADVQVRFMGDIDSLINDRQFSKSYDCVCTFWGTTSVSVYYKMGQMNPTRCLQSLSRIWIAFLLLAELGYASKMLSFVVGPSFLCLSHVTTNVISSDNVSFFERLRKWVHFVFWNDRICSTLNRKSLCVSGLTVLKTSITPVVNLGRMHPVSTNLFMNMSDCD